VGAADHAGASLLVLSALRSAISDWTAGWALLVTSRLAGAHGPDDADSCALCTGGRASAFVLAIGLFAAQCSFTSGTELLTPLVAIAGSVAGFAVARAALWPDSLPLRVALEVSYRIILLAAVIALLRAGGDAGAFVVAAGYVLTGPAFEVGAVHSQIPSEIIVTADMLLELSMLCSVLRKPAHATGDCECCGP